MWKLIRAMVLSACVLLSAGGAYSADPQRDEKQAELDAACEAARESRLAPLRAGFVDECVQNRERESRAECEAFYSDYGAQSGGRAPLFYDLPECVEAFEYQKSERQRNGA